MGEGGGGWGVILGLIEFWCFSIICYLVFLFEFGNG